MGNGLIVGIDAGTSLVKALAFDHGRSVVARSHLEHTFSSPRPGWAELDMDDLWDLVVLVLRQLTNELGARASEIEAVGVSGTMIGAWLIDSMGAPVRPGILWNDGRSVDLLTIWRSEGILDQLFEIGCNMLNPGFTAAVLSWLVEHEPETIAKASTCLFQKDWIRFRLTGELATEETDASHFPGDVHTRGYSDQVLRLCGIPQVESLLPRVIGSGDVAGHVTPEASIQTGLPAGIPVVAGLADVSSALFGLNAKPADAVTVLGTSCLNNFILDHPVFEPAGIGLSFVLPQGLVVRSFPNQTGTLALDWVRKSLFGDRVPSTADLESAAAEVPAGANGMMFHPYLNSTGVVSPVYEPRARGRFSGIELAHGVAEFARAVYEGLALSIADNYGALSERPGRVMMIGGGSRSALLTQMVADVIGLPVYLPAIEEPGAYGVARLAGAATGHWPLDATSSRDGSSGDRILYPDPTLADFYVNQLARYRFLRNRLTEEANFRGGSRE